MVDIHSSDDDEGRWVKVPEAVRLLGISPQAVHGRVSRNSLLSRRNNRGKVEVYIAPDDLNGVNSADQWRDELLVRPRNEVADLRNERDKMVAAHQAERDQLLALLHQEREQLPALIEKLLSDRRRRWPGLKTWWRRVWEGEG